MTEINNIRNLYFEEGTPDKIVLKIPHLVVGKNNCNNGEFLLAKNKNTTSHPYYKFVYTIKVLEKIANVLKINVSDIIIKAENYSN